MGLPLTSIGNRLTPSNPSQLTFGQNIGLPSPLLTVCIIGHRGAAAASGSTGVTNYQVIKVNNTTDANAASGEVAGYCGAGSEIAQMVYAFVEAIEAEQGGTFPNINICPLASTDTDFGGGTNACLANIQKLRNDWIVSPYDGLNQTLGQALLATCQTMSGPERVENNQFGTFGAVFNRSVVNPASLPNVYNSFNFEAFWLRDTGTGANAPAYSVAQMCAAAVAQVAANAPPFNPMDSLPIGGVAAPLQNTDWISVGAGSESETALEQGWTPLKVRPDGSVGYVRTITTRTFDQFGNPITNDTYIDVQDFQVAFYWREAWWNAQQQPQFKNVKNSNQKVRDVRGAAVQLAGDFEDMGMFQAVAQLSKLFLVQKNATDRSRMDCQLPINIIPGLHVIATNTVLTTLFDDLLSLST
jgi:phage tail sheath gpL-like